MTCITLLQSKRKCLAIEGETSTRCPGACPVPPVGDSGGVSFGMIPRVAGEVVQSGGSLLLMA